MSIEIYNTAYCENYKKLAETDLGKRIYAERWRMIEKYVQGALHVFDYGCASGAFHRSSPNGFVTSGFDINPACGYTRMPTGKVDVLTLWDSLEHVYDPLGLVIKLEYPEWIFLSTPNLESVRGDIRAWRHYRPGEHIYYFDIHSLKEILDYCGYEILEHNHYEGALRDPKNPEAILSIVAKRR